MNPTQKLLPNEVLPPIGGHTPNPLLGFGERALGWPTQQSTCDKLRRFALPLLLGLFITTTGALLGTIVGVPIALIVGSAAIIGIGAAIGSGVGFIAVATLAVIMVCRRYRQCPDTKTLLPKVPVSNAIPVGKFNNENSIVVTKNAKETSAWKLDLLASAKQSIEISGSFCGGPIFREALDVIEKNLKTNNKLQVHLISAPILLDSQDLKKLNSLAKQYPNQFHLLVTQQQFTLDPSFRTRENHVKVLCIDEKFFVVGGTNFCQHMGTTTGDQHMEFPPKASLFDKFMPVGYRDMDIVGKGRLAKTLRLEFYKLWAMWKYRIGKTKEFANRYFAINQAQQKTAVSQKWEKAKKNRVIRQVNTKVLICDPCKPNAITAEYVRVIDQAKKVIRIANYSFSPTSEIMSALQRAKKRNVKIEIITNGLLDVSSTSHSFFLKSNDASYLPLLVGRPITKNDTKATLLADYTEGLNIYEYAMKNVNLHKKILIGDDTLVIGSYNIGAKSHECDDELNLTIESPEVVKQVMKSLDGDITRSREMTFDKAYANHDTWMGRFQRAFVAYYFG